MKTASSAHILSDNHWKLESYRQRITKKQWRFILLSGGDQIFARGELRQLVAKELGAGVVEITKAKL